MKLTAYRNFFINLYFEIQYSMETHSDIPSDTQSNVLSLFSGCGGLDLGIANAGSESLDTNYSHSPFNFVWANDELEHACKTIASNFDKTLVTEESEYDQEKTVYCGDVRTVEFDTITDKNIDLILGGFPCQDFSILQGDEERQGVKVERGRLYLEYVRALAELQPKLFVAENVKGLVSANEGQAYKQILKDFQNLSSTWDDIEEELESKEDAEANITVTDDLSGYTILHSDVVDFSTLGVPQGRERLAIIGVRDDLIAELPPTTQLSEQINENLSSQNNLDSYPLSTIETFEGRTVSRVQQTYNTVMTEFEEYVGKLDSERATTYQNDVWPNYTFDVWDDYVWRNNLDTDDSHNKSAIDSTHRDLLDELGYWREPVSQKEFEDGSNEEMREQSHVLERLRHIPPGENYRMVEDTEHHVTGLMSNIYRRLDPLQPSTTVIASGGGGTWGYHYKRERGKLTNRERARIQTFPDNFSFTGTNAEVRKQIGNAVPPLGAKRIGEQVLTIFEHLK